MTTNKTIWEEELRDNLCRLIKQQYLDCEIIVDELSNEIGKPTYKPNFEDSKKLNTVYKRLHNSYHELEDKIIEKLKTLLKDNSKAILKEVEKELTSCPKCGKAHLKVIKWAIKKSLKYL